jgi:hypothetical protein
MDERDSDFKLIAFFPGCWPEQHQKTLFGLRSDEVPATKDGSSPPLDGFTISPNQSNSYDHRQSATSSLDNLDIAFRANTAPQMVVCLLANGDVHSSNSL